MTFFQNIVLQSKDDNEDWRSFLHFLDEDRAQWELRGYGKTLEETATNAWNRYLDSENWENYRYTLKGKLDANY